jgi:LmbE family N-acetylglucosaminyl deacetylase
MAARRIALLEPHPDDGALSLGGWIASRPLATPMETIVVFSESRWAPYLSPDTPVQPARLAEQGRFVTMFGLSFRDLGLPDASSIGLSEEEELHSTAERDWRAAPCLAAVASVLSPEVLVLVPLGIGNHIDHVLTRDCCPKSIQQRAYYEELPYASHVAPDAAYAVARQVMGREPRRWRFDIGSVLERKRAALSCFASQLSSADIEHVLRTATDASGRSVERIWTPGDNRHTESILESMGFCREPSYSARRACYCTSSPA